MSTIERASPTDLMQLASDVGPVPNQIAGVLRLAADGPRDAEAFAELVARRLGSVPRLGQRLASTPLGGGRPVWLDDPDHDPRDHVRVVPCPVPGDERALLDLVARVATTPFPSDRPRWAATVVTDLADGSTAVIVALHHVLADGVGGLAVLACLVDGLPRLPSRPRRRPPTRRELRQDALRGLVSRVGRLPRAPSLLRAALRELAGAPRSAPRWSFNQPTGPRRRLALVRVDLAAVRSAAHRAGATVNDVILTAVAGALGELAGSRGDHLEEVVLSTSVAARTTATATDLGNQVGVVTLRLPVGGEPQARLRAIAAVTRARKGPDRGASAVLLAPSFRLLARLRLLRWLIERQRVVTAFATNLRGPAQPLAIGTVPVRELFAVSAITGNTPAGFAVLSYAGALTVTVIVDDDLVPDLDVLVAALEREVAALGC